MACKKCGGLAQQKLDSEFSISFPDIKRLNVPPVYVCNSLLVCMDCGFAELTLPQPEPESLRKGTAATRSQDA